MGFLVERQGDFEVTTRGLKVVDVRACISGTFDEEEFEELVVRIRDGFNDIAPGKPTCRCRGIDRRTPCPDPASGEDGLCDHCRKTDCENDSRYESLRR